MSLSRIAYLPLITHPQLVSDRSVVATIDFSAVLGYDLQTTAFSVDVPNVSSPLGGFLINIPDLVRTIEDNSRAHCEHLRTLVAEKAGSRVKVHFSTREVVLGEAAEVAVDEARYCDLVLLPWSAEDTSLQDLAQSLLFGSGRPCIIVPPRAAPAKVDHIAIAWDASRVATRALADALPMLADGGHVSILTVQGEKPLGGPNIAEKLSAALVKRGIRAEARRIDFSGRPIGEILQVAAIEDGAQLLVMGGYGHSRIRDFVLGGATKGVLNDLRLPVLLSH